MKKVGIAFADLCSVAAPLPGVEQSTSYGTPALKVRGKLMLRLINEGQTIALRCGREDRERLLAASPKVFFITPHYQGHPWILVRLPMLDAHAAPRLLEMAWRLAAPPALLKQRDAIGDNPLT